MYFGVLLTLMFSAIFSATFAIAQVPANIAVANVLEGWRDANGRHYAALSIQMAPGWNTYWRTPGAAGIPPVFDWAASENILDVTVSFPVPEVTEKYGLTTIGYTDQVVFPLSVQPIDENEDINLRGQILIGVCQDICVPMAFEITATLQSSADDHSPVIIRAMNDLPLTARRAGVHDVECEIVPISDGLRLTARVGLARLGQTEIAVVELADRSVWVSEPLVRRDGNTLVAEADLIPLNTQPFLLSRSDVRITVFGGGRAVDIQGCS